MDIHFDDLYPEGINDERRDWKVDTLEISESTFWGDKQTFNLILLCQRHKVECLQIGEPRGNMSLFPLCFMMANIEDVPPGTFFYTNLQAIVIGQHVATLPNCFEMLFTRTSIWSVIFIISDLPRSSRHKRMRKCLKHILDQKWLRNGSNVMEVRFETPDEIEYEPPDCPEWTRAKHLLTYNLIMREKCKLVAFIFLGSKKIKKAIGKDVCGIIARMIWSTRGYPDWRKPILPPRNPRGRK